jgi:pantetheine-phosphate adenylyltransferase
MASLRIGVYPGTFDPITNGHLDIIVRAAKLVDRLVVAVAVNAGKGPLFEIDERVRLVQEEIKAQPNGLSNRVEVRKFDNLTVQFAAEVGANAIIRGLRAVSDFDYEFQMSSMNAKLAPDIETLCLMASDKYQFIAARLVKEIATMGGDVSGFVSPRIAARLAERLKNGK